MPTWMKIRSWIQRPRRRPQGIGQDKVPVELALANEEGFPHKGYIESFDNRLDPNTGTILLRAVFPSENGLIVPGLFAHIRIPMTAKHQAVLIDESAIGTDQAQKFVLTLGKDNKVEYRKVILGPAIEGKRVVRDGLKAGEKIVVNGLQRAHPRDDGFSRGADRRCRQTRRANRATLNNRATQRTATTMNIAFFFIKRPVFAAVLSIIIFCSG